MITFYFKSWQDIKFPNLLLQTVFTMVFEVDECLQRLAAMKGAVGGVVLTMHGELIKSTLDPATTIQVRYFEIDTIKTIKY